MKPHRNILFISLLISVISLILVVFISKDEKLFQVSLALMGSSFISFMLEIPNYISLKKENANKLYYSLFDLKGNIAIFINIIDTQIEYYDIITDKFYEPYINSILSSLNSLRTLDQNHYISKKKNELIIKALINFNNAYNNLNISSLDYSVSFSKKKLDIVKSKGIDANISPLEMNKELSLIINSCYAFLQIIEEEAPLILPKSKVKQWVTDNAIIVNNRQNFKNIKKASKI